MPLYDFRCRTCEHVEELLVTLSESSNAQTCSKCGAAAERQTVSRVNLQSARPVPSGERAAFSNADSFVKAMDNFGDSVGSRLTRQEKDQAISRLESAKKN